MKINLNTVRQSVINTLKSASKPMTLAEISTAIGTPVKSGTTNALVQVGAIVKAGKVEVSKKVKSKVATYVLGTVALADTKLKANEIRTAIVNLLADGQARTLAEISTAIGTEVKSGTTNALLTANVLAKAEMREIIKDGKSKVETYTIGNLAVLEKAE